MKEGVVDMCDKASEFALIAIAHISLSSTSLTDGVCMIT